MNIMIKEILIGVLLGDLILVEHDLIKLLFLLNNLKIKKVM